MMFIKTKIGRILFLPCIFNFVFTFSQTIYFKDKKSEEPIQYIEIEYGNNIYYSDSLGVFKFDDIKENTFRLTDFNVEFAIPKNDSIILVNNAIHHIEEINLKKKENIAFLDYKSKGIYIFGEGGGLNLLIENKSNTPQILNSIELYPKKILNKSFYMKIDFYRNNSTYEKLNSQNIFVPLSTFKNRRIKEIDLKKYNIPITKEGTMMKISFVKNINSNIIRNYSNEVAEFYLSKKVKSNIKVFNFTTRKTMDITTIFMNLYVLQ